jgi:Zn-dependent protease with chaperone function
VRAAYYDGQSANRFDVDIALSSASLTITTAAGAQTAWPRASVHLVGTEGVGEGMRLGSPTQPDARLVLTDADTIATLGRWAPWLLKSPPRRRAWAWAGASAVAVGLLLWLGPSLAGPLARCVPRGLERKLGDAAASSLMAQARDVGAGEIDAQLSAFAEQMQPTAAPVRVRLVDRDVQNAFALPGGQIVVYCGLLRELHDGDELAGVLAHEAAHVALHHGTEAMIRVLGMGALFSLVSGDLSAIHGAAAEFAKRMLVLANSRRAEAQADAEAIAALARAGFGTGGLSHFLARHAAHSGRMPSFLSTHPADALRAQAACIIDGAPAFDSKQWGLIQAACAAHDSDDDD